jgi:chaperonin cofactor prefoldin
MAHHVEVDQMRILKPVCWAAMAVCLVVAPAHAQRPQSDDYQQRVTNALSNAKQSADKLKQQHEQLLQAIQKAGDPKEAQRVLDDVINSASGALDGFSDNAPIFKDIDNLLAFSDARRKVAQDEAARDPRWLERIDYWKKHGENIQQLRQDIKLQAARAGAALNQLKKDRKFIEDIIAGEQVAKAKAALEEAVQNLKQLADSLTEAVKVAEDRNRTITTPGF